MVRRIICDMDGLLVDTERLQSRCSREALNIYDICLKEEDYCDFWIRQGKGMADYIRENNLNISPDEIRSKRKVIYHNLLRNELTTYAGVIEKLEELFKIYPLALVSDSYRDDVELILEISCLKKYFGLTVTGTDVKKPKPDPEGMLIVSDIWNDVWGGVWNGSPQDIVVLGDAEKDINAAKKAGMKSIAVPNKYTEHNDFSNAGAVLSSISEVTIDLIDGL